MLAKGTCLIVIDHSWRFLCFWEFWGRKVFSHYPRPYCTLVRLYGRRPEWTRHWLDSIFGKKRGRRLFKSRPLFSGGGGGYFWLQEIQVETQIYLLTLVRRIRTSQILWSVSIKSFRIEGSEYCKIYLSCYVTTSSLVDWLRFNGVRHRLGRLRI